MAEKEEFLFVLPVEESDELRNIIPYCNGCTFWPCDEECINRKKPITRQEAIRKMCDAYFKAKDKGLMESERVEAALNALLEGK